MTQLVITSTIMLDRKHFVTDADLEIGGHIQKLVAIELHISEGEQQRLFWEEQGGRTRRKSRI